MIYDGQGIQIIKLREVDSTNRFANELVNSGQLAEGAVILAQFQIAGKGQRENKWESQDGMNITGTLVLHPDFQAIERLFILNQMIAVSICEILQDLTSAEIRIKWPNDIMAGDEKIAGILIENSIKGNKCHLSLAGVGVNINQFVFQPYNPVATSLAILEKNVFDTDMIAEKIFGQIFKNYKRLKTETGIEFSTLYFENLYRRDKEASYESDGKIFEGVLKGVDPVGNLLIESNGKTETFRNKEVRFLF